jgi:inner membrane protein
MYVDGLHDMTGRTHDVAAITALGAVFFFTIGPSTTVTLSTILMSILANQIGGIAPDIDQPTAPFWRNLPIGGAVGRVVDKLLGGHRFITHSLIGVVLFGFLAHLLLTALHPLIPSANMTFVWFAFMIGLLSHLIMDTFTKEGVPWLLPVPIKFGIPPLRRLRITTGKFVENIIVLPGLIALNVLFYTTHYDTVLSIIHRHIQ